jgi:uncharacterized 2Fe-2S/4Fe-4S cluster protein (DUF4445 family)
MNKPPLQTSNNSIEKVCKVKCLPFDISIKALYGSTLLDAIRKAGLPLKTSCGGKGTCGDCKVQIIKGSYKVISTSGLSEKFGQDGYVLSCVTTIQNDLIIKLPAFQLTSIKSVTDTELFESYKNTSYSVYELNPIIKKVELKVPNPTSEYNFSDYKRLERELKNNYPVTNLSCTYSALKYLPDTLRERQGEITAVLINNKGLQTILEIKPGFTKKIYGIACDIGTTTVALKLIDLKQGNIIGTVIGLNRQMKCGDDIISRINYAEKPGHLNELHKLVVETINNLIDEIILHTGISHEDIYYGSFSGNTTMIHLFLEIDPQHIRLAPYVPAFNKVPFLGSDKIAIKMNPVGIYCAPAVGSYVGGDITSGLLCTPIITETDKISMFIDLGTNGEIVIGNHDWMIACACSAGPAFEGSGIRCGMNATEGAIESIKLSEDGSSYYKVIDDNKPKGICGSGLVDLIAELFSHGFIDRYGKFNPKKAKNRLIDNDSGIGFIVEKPEKCFWEKELVITENDIKNLITTKAAVYAACSLLTKNVGISFDKIDKFYIAGGFGKFLNIINAIKIGLLPDMPINKYTYLGNSSLLGAHLILASDRNRELVESIAEKITYLELNTALNYMHEFTGALFLPHTDISLFPSYTNLSQTSH